MKILVENYTFNSSTKQVTLTDYTSVSLESVLLITNVTDNIIIYNFADPAKGGTVSTNVLTLDYDTAAMSNGDSLQIFIDDGESPATNSALETIDLLITQLLKRSESLAVVDTAQRQRVAVEVTPNITVGSVIPTVTVNGNNSNFRPVDSNNNSAYETNSVNTFARYVAVPDVWRTIELARQTYQQAIRSNLIF
jgi:hypothetical protein